MIMKVKFKFARKGASNNSFKSRHLASCPHLHNISITFASQQHKLFPPELKVVLHDLHKVVIVLT